MQCYFNTNKPLRLLYLSKTVQMLVYIRCYLRGNLLFLFHILLLQVIKSLVLLIHGHELLFRTFLFQIRTMGIVNLFWQMDYQRYTVRIHSG